MTHNLRELAGSSNLQLVLLINASVPLFIIN